jgi:hypothetical protein
MEDNKPASANVPKGHQRLQGAERPRAAGAKALGPLNADEQVGFTLLLRDKPGSPPLPDFEHWKKTPPGQRRFLSVQEHIDTYGATQEDLDAVTTYLKSHGFTITEASSGRCSVVAQGTAAQINAAFGVQLNRYEASLSVYRRRLPKNAKQTPTAPATHIYHGFDGSVYLPAELTGIVKAVIGLDNRSLGGHSGTGDPSPTGAVSVPYLASLYNFPNLSASDQTIGVFSGGGSYLASDIQDSYFSSLPPASPPSLPVGYNNPPNLVPISLTYGGETYSNNPSEISSGFATGSDYEVTQDISTSSTIAQGATVNVYFADGTGTELGWVTFLNRLLVPGSETQPSVVTSSFFMTRQDDAATIGDPATTGTTANTISGLLQKVANQGITFLIALGDWGCDDAVIDGNCHVQYPPSDPWVTSCGGTVIGNISGSTPPTFQEYVWSDAHNGGSPFGPNPSTAPDWGATGGGVSDNFPLPPYQVSAGISQTSNNDSKVRRGVPDIAGMVGLSGFYMNGVLYPDYTGTSCVAPLYCGLVAIINSAIGTRTGFLNNILYSLGSSLVHTDVTFGNNDSGDSPHAKPYTAGPGWDACTGWGSLDGTKLLNGVAQSVLTQDMQFWVDDSTFGSDEVKDTASYPDAFWLVLEGFTPNVLGISATNANGNVTPALTSSAFLTLLGSSNITYAGPPVLELPKSFFTPQIIRFPYNINFPSGITFPTSGETPYSLTASITIPGNSTPFTAQTVFYLVAGADPYFTNVNGTANNPAWLSQDLRVFTVCPGLNQGQINGPHSPPVFAAADDNVAGAYAYIQKVIPYLNAQIGYLNSSYVPPLNSDPLDSYLSNQSLQSDSSVTPVTSSGGKSYNNYSFAIARVRLRGIPADPANNTKVFFRLFTTQTNDTDYINQGPTTLADPYITFPSNPSASPDDPQSPLPGTDGSGNINGCTLPFFANNNYGSGPTDYDATGGINNQNIVIPPTREYVWAYFGCFLNVYDKTNLYGMQDPQFWLAGGTHHCLVAQIAYTGAPIENSDGVIENPDNCDKLAQRNLEVTLPSGNPGFPVTHRIAQTLDLRPSPNTILNPTGYLTNYPDQLVIDWGKTPAGSIATLYWPQAHASDVLALAAKFYTTHQLSAVDAHTVQITVSGGAGYIPIPTGTGPNFAGLLTLELANGIRVGDQFNVIIRRITSRQLSGKRDDVAIRNNPYLNWRYVVGTFQMVIPVQRDAEILPLDENLLAILKWRLTLITPSNRWYPILLRYIGILEGRIKGCGGHPHSIPPSQWGTANPPGTHGKPGHHAGHHGAPGGFSHGGDEFTGKVNGLIYDRFGDFEGFMLLTEEGHERSFHSHEEEIERLVYDAWSERQLISVFVHPHDPHWPSSIVLRRRPRRFEH